EGNHALRAETPNTENDAIVLGHEESALRVGKPAADVGGRLVRGPRSNCILLAVMVGAAKLGDRGNEHAAHCLNVVQGGFANSHRGLPTGPAGKAMFSSSG